MAYIEVHATLDGITDISTKKALKALVNSDASSRLCFEAVSPFNQFSGGLDKITEGTTLQVTGPNPWNARNWYANIKIVNGKIKVS